MMYIKKGGIDSNRMVDFINKFINGKYKNKLIILRKRKPTKYLD
jgi:hypothetical protein